MLRVVRSNRLEPLVEALAAELASAPLEDPIAPELVVVHSRAMERWLRQRLAERLGTSGGRDGVCANVEMPFPAAIVRRVVSALVGPEARGEDPFAPEPLAWSLLAALRELRDEPELAPLDRYLDRGAGTVDRRAYNLARHLSDLFDRYLAYRPDWTLAWAAGRAGADEPELAASGWQRRVFRELCRRIGEPSPAERTLAARRLLCRAEAPPEGLPARLALFGLGSLPAPFLELFLDLARVVDVHLYLPCPSEAYFGHVRSRREIARALGRAGGAAPSELHLEQGNPLLASLGRLARDFHLALEGREALGHEGASHDLFVDPWGGPAGRPPSALEVLQSDVLRLRHRHRPTEGAEPTELEPAPVALGPADRSVGFHSCHGPSRQVEVLREVLLDLLDRDPSLEPRDLVVMTPEVATYGPLVSAVFSETEPVLLPFALADRSLRRQNPLAEALMRVVELAGGRLPASSLLALLALEPVRLRFGIEAAELPRIEGWLARSGVRWGRDAEHRAALGLPAERANSFEAGLDRLLLGVAMPGEGRRLFASVLPVDDLEGEAVELVGRLAELCRTLVERLRALEEPRSVGGWVRELRATLAATTRTAPGDEALELEVRDALAALELEAGARYDGPVGLDGIRAVLDRLLSLELGAAGHQTGAITFCSMAPLRSVPHRVVCLLGMDDGAFPTPDRDLGFDLIAASPRAGDRSRRDEDRQLLLEAVLAARQHLVVLWTGRDPRSNAACPPAVPVSELLELCDESFEAGPGLRARDRLLVEHPLQPWSPRCFGIGPDGAPVEPTSYDRTLAEAVEARAETEPPPFFDGALPGEDREAEARTVSLSELVAFFEGPVRHLMRRRLGLSLDERLVQVRDREPVELDPLERWQVGDDLLRLGLEGFDEELASELVRASGRLPFGELGRAELARLAAEARAVAERARQCLEGSAPEKVAVSVRLRDELVEGTVDRLQGEGRVAIQFGEIRPKQLVEPWLSHLALTAARPERAWVSRLIGRETGTFKGLVRLASLGGTPEERRERASAVLAELVSLYRRGLSEPLLFFPASSWAYHEALRKAPAEPEAAVRAALEAWRPKRPEARGEGDEAHHLQAFGAHCPFVDARSGRLRQPFHDAALAFFGPLAAARSSR